MAITHTTPADSSFTPRGKVAWEEAHTLTPPVVMGTPTLGTVTALLRFPTPDPLAGDFILSLDDDLVVTGDRDNVFTLGYNLSSGQAQEVLTEPAFGICWETNFDNGGANLWEFHLAQGSHIDGTSFRALSVGADRTTKVLRHDIAVDIVTWYDSTIVNQAMTLTPTTSTAVIGLGTVGGATSTSIAQYKNNIQWLSQEKNDNSGLIEMVRVSTTNRVVIDPGGAGANSAGEHQFNSRVYAPAGTRQAPSYSCSSFGGAGMFFITNAVVISATSTNTVDFDAGNVEVRTGSSFAIGWSSTSDPASAVCDAKFVRDTSNTIGQKNGTSSQTLNHYGTEISASRYSRLAIKHSVSTLASVNGASVTATSLIPAKANVLGVNTVVTVSLGTGGGTTGYTVGDGSDADRWGAVTGTAAGTDTDGNDATADPTGWFTAANNVVITAAGGNFNGTGSILIDVSYTITEAD